LEICRSKKLKIYYAKLFEGNVLGVPTLRNLQDTALKAEKRKRRRRKKSMKIRIFVFKGMEGEKMIQAFLNTEKVKKVVVVAQSVNTDGTTTITVFYK